MSQLNVSSSNSSQINIINNSHDADVSDVLGNELKKDFDEKTDLKKIEQMKKNIEQLNTDLNAKPESTLHKVERFLSGILGGILLAEKAESRSSGKPGASVSAPF